MFTDNQLPTGVQWRIEKRLFNKGLLSTRQHRSETSVDALMTPFGLPTHHLLESYTSI